MYPLLYRERIGGWHNGYNEPFNWGYAGSSTPITSTGITRLPCRIRSILNAGVCPTRKCAWRPGSRRPTPSPGATASGAWRAGGPDPIEGLFTWTLSVDVRVCLVDGLDAILAGDPRGADSNDLADAPRDGAAGQAATPAESSAVVRSDGFVPENSFSTSRAKLSEVLGGNRDDPDFLDRLCRRRKIAGWEYKMQGRRIESKGFPDGHSGADS